MSADIIPFPKSPNYLAYCHSPEQRDAANAIFELFAEDMPEAAAERVTCDLLRVDAEIAARLRAKGVPPPAS